MLLVDNASRRLRRILCDEAHKKTRALKAPGPQVMLELLDIEGKRNMEFPDEPPRVDPRQEIYKPLPKTFDVLDWTVVDAQAVASAVFERLSAVITGEDVNVAQVEELFHADTCHWRDTLALTAHLRTFTGSSVIAKTLVHLAEARGAEGFALSQGSAMVVSPNAHSVRRVVYCRDVLD